MLEFLLNFLFITNFFIIFFFVKGSSTVFIIQIKKEKNIKNVTLFSLMYNLACNNIEYNLQYVSFYSFIDLENALG